MIKQWSSGHSQAGGDLVKFIDHLGHVIPQILVLSPDVLAQLLQRLGLPDPQRQQVYRVLQDLHDCELFYGFDAAAHLVADKLCELVGVLDEDAWVRGCVPYILSVFY